ncbi:hypothetical protein DB32_006018 [Sandaracinus amylolyticus]|uniref:Uncharacterized protein n=2 Tax=Sandaracinus amylolyticus TaxID=927083 RepID=A0A0F6SGK8_9BACT|nr:hypothetical protein DB32_006018 [Sandaracinus amylolyticus]
MRPELRAIFERAEPADEQDLAALEQRSQREARRERLARSGIRLRPDDRKALMNDELYPTQALRDVKRWLAAATRTPNPGPNFLFVTGGTGLGKTVAAAWALTRQGGRFVTMETFLLDYARYLRDVSRDRAAELERERYAAPGLLVLDELGTEADAVLARTALSWLVDARCARRRHLTIVLSNLAEADVVARFTAGIYDPRTWDRLRRDGAFAKLDGESLRRPDYDAAAPRRSAP